MQAPGLPSLHAEQIVRKCVDVRSFRKGTLGRLAGVREGSAMFEATVG